MAVRLPSACRAGVGTPGGTWRQRAGSSSVKPGAAGQGQGLVGVGRPDGHGAGAERFQGVLKDRLRDGLGVPCGEGACLGAAQAQAHGGGGRLGGLGEEVTRHVGDLVAGGLVDEVSRQFERGDAGLRGQAVQLGRRLDRAARRRSTRMPLARSTSARPSASAWARRSWCRSRWTVSASRPTALPSPVGRRPPGAGPTRRLSAGGRRGAAPSRPARASGRAARPSPCSFPGWWDLDTSSLLTDRRWTYGATWRKRSGRVRRANCRLIRAISSPASTGLVT